MRTIKKMLVLFLVLAMALSLCACGKFETKMAKAAQKMSKLESYRLDLDVDVQMKLSAMGQSMDMDMALEGQMDVMAEPLTMGGSMTADAMGQEIGCLYYAEEVEEGYAVYLSLDQGKTWTRQILEKEDIPMPSKTKTVAGLAKVAADFKETGTETIRGSEATVFSGNIYGKDIGLALKLSGGLEELGQALDMDLSSVDLSKIGDIPSTVAIDNKSGMVVRYTMDMTEIMQNLMGVFMDVVMEKVAEEVGMGNVDPAQLGLEIEVTSVTAEGEMYDFDAVKSVEIPRDAREAKAA